MGIAGLVKEEKQVKTPLVRINFTNAICYGKTGSGKTSGFILPNIENRIKHNHGILVYDFKGNTHELVKKIAKKYNKLERVIEIGTPWGEKTNIIQNLDSRTLRDIFMNMHGGSREPFWQNSAANLFSAIYKIQMNLQRIVEHEELLEKKRLRINKVLFGSKEQDVSLASIFNVVNSVESLEDFFKTMESEIQSIVENIEMMSSLCPKEPIIKHFALHLERIEEALSEIKAFRKLNSASSKSEIGGLYSVLDVASSTISNAGTNEYINKNSLNIAQSLREGNIIVVNLGNLDNSMLGVFNLSVYKALQSGLTHQEGCAVSIFIDEAQKVLHPNYLPDVDVCRESRFEYIFATQDELLLHDTIGMSKTEMLLRNVVEQYSFASNNIDDELMALREFEYKNLLNDKKKFAQPMFFTKKELFDTEYSYQSLKKLDNFIEEEQIKELDIQERYVLLNSPNLHERNEICIKTQNQKIHTLRMTNFDEGILDKYVPVEKEENQEDDLYNIVKEKFKDNVLTKQDNKKSKEEVPTIQNRIIALEILYSKATSKINFLEKSREIDRDSIRELKQKTTRLEAMIMRVTKENRKELS